MFIMKYAPYNLELPEKNKIQGKLETTERVRNLNSTAERLGFYSVLFSVKDSLTNFETFCHVMKQL